MSRPNIIRAWKDEEYRLSLSEAELAALPPHPAGLVDKTDEIFSYGPEGIISPFSFIFSCMAVCGLV